MRKFKVGDRVKILGKDDLCNHAEMGYTVGKVGTIKHIDDMSRVTVMIDKDETSWEYRMSNLKKLNVTVFDELREEREHA
jgi:hypothetical protein